MNKIKMVLAILSLTTDPQLILMYLCDSTNIITMYREFNMLKQNAALNCNSGGKKDKIKLYFHEGPMKKETK